MSEPRNEERQPGPETAAEEEHVATTDGGQETVSDIKGDSEDISGFTMDKDVAETDKKESGDAQNVPDEETVESQSVADVVESERSKTVSSETSSEKEEKTKDKAAADWSSAPPKESASVDGGGGDRKKSSSEERGCDADAKDGKASGGSAAAAAASCNKNLCVGGLSSSTRAIDLKTHFSKYGKVVGAKVVTTAKSPGACFGFVAMSSPEEAALCISRLHKTELHGNVISVDWVKNESTEKKPADSTDSKSEGEGRNGKGRNERSVDKDGRERSRDRRSLSEEKKDILSFDQIKERQRGMRYRYYGDGDTRRTRSRSRDSSNISHDRMSLERDYLDDDCDDDGGLDPDYLERETMRIEALRRREAANIRREREELRRLEDQGCKRTPGARATYVGKRPYERKDEWQDKRMAMDDRYATPRYQDADYHGRAGRYQDDWTSDNRRDTFHSGDRQNQHFSVSDRSDRYSRGTWKTGYNKHFNSRGGGRDWDSGRKRDRDRPWQHKMSPEHQSRGEASTSSSSMYSSSSSRQPPSPPPRARYSPSDIAPTGRSRLLQEFQDQYLPNLQLRELEGHVVEFAQHPNGSRFIQKKLRYGAPADIEMVLEEILRVGYPLMMDTFANYIIQRLLELGSAEQRVALATPILGHVLALIQHKAGCQVIQKALEYIPSDQQIISDVVRELADNVLACVWERSGRLVHNPNGCRVLQRILEHCSHEQTAPILEELHKHTEELIYDQCGNYVIQHVLEHGRPEDKSRIIEEVRGKVFAMSQHIYSSRVVSRCVIHSSPEERAALIDEVCSQTDGHHNAIYSMMKDKYGSYVVQKMLHKANPLQREIILQKMQPDEEDDDAGDVCEEDGMKS